VGYWEATGNLLKEIATTTEPLESLWIELEKHRLYVPLQKLEDSMVHRHVPAKGLLYGARNPNSGR
jgi:hypothetical protein